MNEYESCEFGPLDAMKSLEVWMIGTILGHVPMTLNAMNNSGLWMT